MRLAYSAAEKVAGPLPSEKIMQLHDGYPATLYTPPVVVQNLLDDSVSNRGAFQFDFTRPGVSTPTAGNLLLVLSGLRSDGTNGYEVSIPGGFNRRSVPHFSNAANNYGVGAYTKIADGTETVLQFMRSNATFPMVGVLLEIAGANEEWVDAISRWSGNCSAGLMSLLSATPDVGDGLALAVYQWLTPGASPTLSGGWDLKRASALAGFYGVAVGTQTTGTTPIALSGSATSGSAITNGANVLMVIPPYGATPQTANIEQAVTVGDGNLTVSTVTFDSSVGWVTPTAGNLLLIIDGNNDGLTPAGFTKAYPKAGDPDAITVFKRISDGTESSVTVETFGGALIEISGFDPNYPIDSTMGQIALSTKSVFAAPLVPFTDHALGLYVFSMHSAPTVMSYAGRAILRVASLANWDNVVIAVEKQSIPKVADGVCYNPMGSAIDFMTAMTLFVKMAPTNNLSVIGALPNATVNEIYSATLTLGGTYTGPVTITGLPAWMSASVSGSSMMITGTAPGSVGTGNFTLLVTDANRQQAMWDGSIQVVEAIGSNPAHIRGNLVASVVAVTSLFVPFDDSGSTPAATSGNVLTAAFYTIKSRLSATPSGWTPVLSQLNAGQALQVFTKVSDGMETGITFSMSGTYAVQGAIIESANASVGSISSGIPVVPATTAAFTFGPSDAPVSADAIPLFFVATRRNRGAVTASGWTTTWGNSGSYANGGYFYQSAPNAAVSVSTVAGNAGAATEAVWANVWLEPA